MRGLLQQVATGWRCLQLALLEPPEGAAAETGQLRMRFELEIISSAI